MSVATWLKSVFTTQTATNYKSNIDACFAVAERIVDNFAPRQSTTPAMTVTLDAGALYNGQILTEVATQTTGTITAPATNPRIDRVVINKATGVVSVIIGTPAGSPTPPALTAGVYPIAQVLLQTTSTTIVNSMLTDERSVRADTGTQMLAAPTRGTPVGGDYFAILNSVTGFFNILTLTNLAAYLAGLCSAGWNAFTATTATALAQGTRGYTLTAEQATTSGTSIDFTGIPAWATKIWVIFRGVSTNGAQQLQIRIGPSGGVETTGYEGGAVSAAVGATTYVGAATGFIIEGVGGATYVRDGVALLVLQNAAAFRWNMTSNVSNYIAGSVGSGSGSKACASALARVSITGFSGTDTFDAGGISLAYE